MMPEPGKTCVMTRGMVSKTIRDFLTILVALAALAFVLAMTRT